MNTKILLSLRLLQFSIFVSNASSDCQFSSKFLGGNSTVIILSSARVTQKQIFNSLDRLEKARVASKSYVLLDDMLPYISTALLTVPRYARFFVMAKAYEVQQRIHVAASLLSNIR